LDDILQVFLKSFSQFSFAIINESD